MEEVEDDREKERGWSEKESEGEGRRGRWRGKEEGEARVSDFLKDECQRYFFDRILVGFPDFRGPKCRSSGDFAREFPGIPKRSPHHEVLAPIKAEKI
jgi:hypothetical protein